jgi:AAHS family benzoate transporter-like MFS transporter
VGRLGAILGPLYGSLLLSTGLPVQVLLAAFTAPALIGAVLVTVMPTPSTVADRGPVVSPGASSRSRRVQRRHQP